MKLDIYSLSSRYTLTCSSEALEKRFSVDSTDAYKPTYNAAPTHLLPVITNEDAKGFSFFYWGATPKMANDKTISPKLFNASAEDLLNKVSYRNALKSRRCIVPVDGYYEWKRISKKGRTPYWIHMPEKTIFSFAGIWDEYDDEDGETHHTFRVITVANNHLLDSPNPDMPAILEEPLEKEWLNAESSLEDLVKLLKPFPTNGIESYSVSPRVNDTTVNSEDLIKHVPPADQFGNYSLFN